MKRFATGFLLAAACCSCGITNRSNSPPDDGRATLVVNRSDDPFVPSTLSLRQPGQSGAGPAGAGDKLADGANATALFDFSSAFSGAGIRSRIVSWRRSGSEAAAEARRTGLPLLIFLSNHAASTATMMENMLNTAPDAAVIGRHFIPLYIDFGDKDTRDSPYYRAVLERYKPRGYPVLLAALPDGTEVNRQNGYAGDASSEPDWRRRTIQFIGAAASQCEKAAAARRKRLQQTGYRVWSSNDGRPVFARLENLDANLATFTGEWGDSFRTFTNRLSESDRQAALAEDAAHRGNPKGG